METTPQFPNYSSILVAQEVDEEENSSPRRRISKRNALFVSVVVTAAVALLVGRVSSPLFLYGPLLGPYLDGDGARGRRKAVKTLLKLANEIDGDVYFLNDVEFCDASKVWQKNGISPPLAVVQVASEADVQLALPTLAEIYLKRGVPFRVRAGGHSYAGFSTKSRGVVLSLQRLNHYEFDESTGIATLQPAVQVQDLLDGILVPDGFGGVTGECPGVAEGGFVLGKPWKFQMCIRE